MMYILVDFKETNIHLNYTKETQKEIITMKWLQFYCVSLIAMLVILEGIGTNAAPSYHDGDMLKTLLDLERKYAAVARPSLRSDSTKSTRSITEPKVQRAINMLRLQNLDKLYAEKSRPRFGKRADDGFNFQAPDYEGLPSQ
ncbi:uncharacterized protein [Onthophagus taurus]|uniref:uncharacterized protein isoform X2 n=1 Tax=Onthophagus taurus TaxID=166361 RepID=UPI0039BE505C